MMMILTPKQIAPILRLRKAGFMQKEICKRVGLSKFLVSRTLHRAGLAMHKRIVVSPAIEARALAMLGENHSPREVAERLELKPHVVRKIGAAHGYKRKGVGAKYNLDILTLRAIRKAIRESEAAIARRFGVSHAWLRKFRLRMWDCVGEKHWKKKRAVAVDPRPDMEKVIDKIAECFDGVLPRNVDAVADGVLESVPVLKQASPKARADFRAELVIALRKRLAESGANRWLN